jgi:glutamine amidotransferase
MWALNWSFCHNGQIPLFDDHPDTWLGNIPGDRMYYPVGTTDSEKAFCAILNSLRAEFTGSMPSLPVLHDRIRTLCDEIIEYDPQGTILNFLLACGPHALWVYSFPGKRPGSSTWNGLHYTVRSRSTCLGDEDYAVTVSIPGNSTNGCETSSFLNGFANNNDETFRSRQICIVATTPLTNDEEWIELKPRESILFDEGLPHVSPRELFRVELQGHGLDNNGKVLTKARLEEDMRQYEFHKEFYVGGGI